MFLQSVKVVKWRSSVRIPKMTHCIFCNVLSEQKKVLLFVGHHSFGLLSTLLPRRESSWKRVGGFRVVIDFVYKTGVQFSISIICIRESQWFSRIDNSEQNAKISNQCFCVGLCRRRVGRPSPRAGTAALGAHSRRERWLWCIPIHVRIYVLQIVTSLPTEFGLFFCNNVPRAIVNLVLLRVSVKGSGSIHFETRSNQLHT